MRLPILLDWLKSEKIDVACLQETKCEDKDFPFEVIEDLGYNVAHFGQKTFNGVALLSKYPLDDIQPGLHNFEDTQSRFIDAGLNVGTCYLKVASVYVPNGQEVGSEKFDYKLSFLEALYSHMDQAFTFEESYVFGGDYNIAPTDRDVYDPASWHEAILCSTPERHAYQKLLNRGYTDILSFETTSEQPGIFTWWDYRAGSFQKNHGLRIDHLLASPDVADRVRTTYVDRRIRELEKTSDHAPVITELEF